MEPILLGLTSSLSMISRFMASISTGGLGSNKNKKHMLNFNFNFNVKFYLVVLACMCITIWYKVVLWLNDMLKSLFCLTKDIVTVLFCLYLDKFLLQRILKECVECTSIHKVTAKSIFSQNMFKTHK